jgi:hypothetical protein
LISVSTQTDHADNFRAQTAPGVRESQIDLSDFTVIVPGITAEVAKMVQDATIPTAAIQIAYALVPEVEKLMARYQADVAFMDLREAADLCGLDHRTLAANIKDVPSLYRESPGTKFVTRNDAGTGGFASGWAVTGKVEPATFTSDHRLDARAIAAFLHPRNIRWSRSKGTGHEAWRLLLAVLVTQGATDVKVSATTASALLGSSRAAGTRALAALAKGLGDDVISEPRKTTVIRLGFLLSCMAPIYYKVEGNDDRTDRELKERKTWLDYPHRMARRDAAKHLRQVRANPSMPADYVDWLESHQEDMEAIFLKAYVRDAREPDETEALLLAESVQRPQPVSLSVGDSGPWQSSVVEESADKKKHVARMKQIQAESEAFLQQERSMPSTPSAQALARLVEVSLKPEPKKPHAASAKSPPIESQCPVVWDMINVE